MGGLKRPRLQSLKSVRLVALIRIEELKATLKGK